MGMKSAAMLAGMGAAAGAVAVLMMPKSSSTRKLAGKAAKKAEHIANGVTDVISDKLS